MWGFTADVGGFDMAIGELFAFREWDDTTWTADAQCKGLAAIF